MDVVTLAILAQIILIGLFAFTLVMISVGLFHDARAGVRLLTRVIRKRLRHSENQMVASDARLPLI